jgi:hypothetical protein
MPYDLKTKSGIVLRNIPDDVDPNAPELKALVQKQLAMRPNAAEIPQLAVSDKAEAARMATEGMSWPERMLVNAGAGFDSAIEGGKQLASKVGIGEGISDDDLREKRARDSALADTTSGGGLAQLAGEAAPTLVIPFGALAKGAGLGVKGLGAVAGRVGAAPIARGAQAAANAIGQGTTRAVVDSALGGALGGAMGPVTSDESRLLNATIGGTIGSALPIAGRAIGAGYRALTKTGAAKRAATEARAALGDRVGDVVQNLDDYAARQRPGDIPLTSAAAAQSADLARMEAGARARNGADFFDADQDQARAVARNVLGATEEAGDLASRKANRQAEWNSNWNTAETVADPAVFGSEMAQLGPRLEKLARSPEASNPAVAGVISQIQAEIARLGDDFTPAHLQQIRANLNARGKAMPTNSYQAAPRDSPAVNRLIDEVDDILNRTTNDAWSGVTGGYAASSRLVDQSKAAGRVRDAFIDPTGQVKKVAADPQGEIPKITEAGLRGAINSAADPARGNLLSPRANSVLNQTLEALRAQGITQRVKNSATSGGGSNTASDNFAAGLLDRAPQGGWISGAWNFAKDAANTKRDAAMVDALRDPAAMRRLLTLAANAPGELTTAERQLLQVLRSTLPAASNEAFTPQ